MKSITRRNFMKNTLAAGVGLTMASPFSHARGANDVVQVAVIGINGRGGGHIKEFRDLKGVRVAALCDVDAKVLERRAKPFRDRNENVDTYIDSSPINVIRVEKEIGAANAGRAFPPGQWGTSTGDVVYLFQFADVPDGASIRDMIVEGAITYNVKKIYPVFGLIMKVEVLGYA